MDPKTILKLQDLNIHTKKIEMCFERYRLASFANYPTTSPQSASRLAEAGFYYTDTDDEVQCFQCGLRVRNWVAGDIPAEVHRRKNKKCKFLKNKSSNVPFQQSPNRNTVSKNNLNISQGPDYRYESQRLSSYVNWPPSAPVHPTELARCGFYFLGRSDRVQCTFCRGILYNWEQGDNPESEHKRHFPLCSFLQNPATSGNIPIKAEDKIAVQKVFDSVITSTAEHPEYCLKLLREKSFERVAYRMGVSVEIMSNAGLYYTGVGDHVKCFYCSGNMTLSEVRDEPWKTHAHLFPNCGFVRMKEEEDLNNQNIQTHKSKANKDNSSSSSSSSEEDKNNNSDTSEEVKNENKTKKKKKNKNNSLNSKPKGGDILAMSTVTEKYENNSPSPDDNNSSSDSSLPDENTQFKNLEEDVEKMKEERRCKVCLQEEVDVVFLKCGHLVCCSSCAPAMRNCPVCRESIKGTIRVFMK